MSRPRHGWLSDGAWCQLCGAPRQPSSSQQLASLHTVAWGVVLQHLLFFLTPPPPVPPPPRQFQEAGRCHGHRGSPDARWRGPGPSGRRQAAAAAAARRGAAQRARHDDAGEPPPHSIMEHRRMRSCAAAATHAFLHAPRGASGMGGRTQVDGPGSSAHQVLPLRLDAARCCPPPLACLGPHSMPLPLVTCSAGSAGGPGEAGPQGGQEGQKGGQKGGQGGG